MSLRALLLRTALQKNKFIKFASVASRSSYQEVHSYHHEHYDDGNKNYGKAIAAAIFSSVLIGSAITDQIDSKKVNESKHQKTENVIVEAGVKRLDLPTYRAEEVSKHDNKSSFWVTFRHGVYDVTAFLPAHPGGAQLLHAGGLGVEPFWNVYGMHHTPEVYSLLETYRIGNLHDDDVAEQPEDELWAREPARDPRLLVKTAQPFNAETPPKLQIQHFDTPNELFYVRQHMPVPELDPETHRLRVIIKGPGSDERVQEFSLQDLQQFQPVTIRAALMCAGNRRSEMNKVKPVKGISWSAGAVGCATWRGVRLRDVLLHCGVDAADASDAGPRAHKQHVILTGSDIDATGVNFSTSIPLDMALLESASVILATHMNGVPLPPDHGHPLRAVVPGAPAVRSVKWLESITVSEDESPSHWHQKDYRAFNPSKTWETADFSSAPPLYSLPVTSAICEPAEGEAVPVRDGCIQVSGYAYSGGGARVVRVDVSADGGRAWTEARLRADAAPPRRHYGWTLWTAAVPVAPHHAEVELWAKATDSNFNTQPEKFEDIWNIRGLLSNAYHRVRVKLLH